MKRIHHSSEPVVLDNNRSYLMNPLAHKGFKPRGLWYSWDGEQSWAEWCESEQFRDTSRQYAYRVLVMDSVDILKLETPKDILTFTYDYPKKLYPGAHSTVIDWETVMKDYDGIEIFPYQWSLRLHHETLWYYGWDCASGCIWNLKDVRLELISEPATMLDGGVEKSGISGAS